MSLLFFLRPRGGISQLPGGFIPDDYHHIPKHYSKPKQKKEDKLLKKLELIGLEQIEVKQEIEKVEQKLILKPELPNLVAAKQVLDKRLQYLRQEEETVVILLMHILLDD